MRGRILLILMLTTATAVKPQVAPSASGGSQTSQTQMLIPPPVSATSYPTEVGAEVRTNYLRGGVTSTTAYINNFYPGSGSGSLAETTISVLSTLAYDSTTARRHLAITYSPGFTFFQPTSELNEVDNTAGADYDIRLTPHLTLRATDNFKNSSLPESSWNNGDSGSVSGAPISSTPGVIPPFAKQLTNSANVELSVQTALNVMIGISGLASELHYPNPTQVSGLYDSNSRGGSVFYNRRVSPSQYFGADYQYLDMLATPAGGTFATQTHTISGYYTFHPQPTLSVSVSGGPQYYRIGETPLPATGSWGPSVSASIGWQAVHTSFAASYSQGVTGGGGLLGAFHSRSANAEARWQLTRSWTASALGAYSINKTVDALFTAGQPGGHAISGSATLEHSVGGRVSIAFHYDLVHQRYAAIRALAADPNSDRETISITWHFERPTGR